MVFVFPPGGGFNYTIYNIRFFKFSGPQKPGSVSLFNNCRRKNLR